MQRLQWTPSDLWYQELAEVCAGNLGGAIAAWRSLVQSAGDRTFRVTEVGRRTIPFVSQLSLRGRAIAAALHTWGPMDIPELAVVTGIPIAAIGGHLHVLCTTGLVRSGPSVFEVDPTLLQPLHQELITLKLCLGDAR